LASYFNVYVTFVTFAIFDYEHKYLTICIGNNRDFRFKCLTQTPEHNVDLKLIVLEKEKSIGLSQNEKFLFIYLKK